MAYEVIADNIEQSRWEQHAKIFADHSIYQSWAYQQVRCEMDRQEVSRIIVKDGNGRVVTMCQMRIKHVRPLGLRIGYVQWGPLFREYGGGTTCTAKAIECILDTYLGRKVNVLRVVPNAEANLIGCRFAAMLESAGFKYVATARPYFTMMLPVDIPEEEMRARLHRSWRKELGRAEKNGLAIKEGSESGYFQIMEKMYLQARRRKGFRGLNPQEFVRAQELFEQEHKMNVVIACHNEEPLSAHASSHFGDTAVGALAATSEKGFECGSSYLVWWRTFLAAKRKGMRRYDLGGIDPKNNFPVYQFKQRMGGEECQYIGAYEICTNSAVKGIWLAAEQMYRLARGK